MKHNNIFLLTLTIIFSSLPASAEEKLSENETLIGKASEYMESGEYDEALKTELKVAGNLKNEKDLIIHVNVYNDLGVIYRHLNRNDSALYYYHKGLETATGLKDKEWLATLTMNLAVFYHNLNHFSDAETYADMAVKYSKEQNEEELFFYACQIAAPIKTEVKKHEEALKISPLSPVTGLRSMCLGSPVCDANPKGGHQGLKWETQVNPGRRHGSPQA